MTTIIITLKPRKSLMAPSDVDERKRNLVTKYIKVRTTTYLGTSTCAT